MGDPPAPRPAALRLAVELEAPRGGGPRARERGVDTERAAPRFPETAASTTCTIRHAKGLDAALGAHRGARSLSGERILVHGDYDVDGITSTFLLYPCCATWAAGRVPDPAPHPDGYGCRLAIEDDAQRRGCALVITVDCGITAVERWRTRARSASTRDHRPPRAAGRCPRRRDREPASRGCGYRSSRWRASA
jgi:single-stranded-DNA-specific exonuclease